MGDIKRLAFVSINGAPWGGSEVLWVATAKEAISKGYAVLISVYDWPYQHPNIEELGWLGAKMIYRRRFYPGIAVRIGKKIRNVFLGKGSKITYHEYLNKFNPQHIFFNLGGGDEIATNNDLMTFVKQLKVPFSVFYHSISITNPFVNAHAADNFSFICNKSTYSFFTSKLQIHCLEEFLNHKISNAQILSHPLRTIFSHAVTLKENVNMCLVGSLFTRWKGQDLVIKILSEKKWKQRKWCLNIYGNGPDAELLKSLSKDFSLDDKIFFHGHVDDINEVFRNNHLVLIPSQQDSGPIVLFEAMLAAIPVVGSFMGAMPDYIKTGVNGVLAKGTDSASFSEALEFAWSNQNKWFEWGQEARKYILEAYDFNGHKTLLERLIS